MLSWRIFSNDKKFVISSFHCPHHNSKKWSQATNPSQTKPKEKKTTEKSLSGDWGWSVFLFQNLLDLCSWSTIRILSKPIPYQPKPNPKQPIHIGISRFFQLTFKLTQELTIHVFPGHISTRSALLSVPIVNYLSWQKLEKS